MAKSTNSAVKQECVRLRLEERCSLGEIQLRSGVPKSTLNYWLQSSPLTAEEKAVRRSRGMLGNHYGTPKKERGERSLFHEAASKAGVLEDRHVKGKIAEAAVLFRLVLHGLEVYGSPFDGDHVDWVVRNQRGVLFQLQVKSAREGGRGTLPTIPFLCSAGRGKQKRIPEESADFLVGYDLYTDTAYVWPCTELEGRTNITVSPEAAERWSLMTDSAEVAHPRDMREVEGSTPSPSTM